MVEIFMSNCEIKNSQSYDEIILVYGNTIRYGEKKNDCLILHDETRIHLVNNYYIKIGEFNETNV